MRSDLCVGKAVSGIKPYSESRGYSICFNLSCVRHEIIDRIFRCDTALDCIT